MGGFKRHCHPVRASSVPYLEETAQSCLSIHGSIRLSLFQCMFVLLLPLLLLQPLLCPLLLWLLNNHSTITTCLTVQTYLTGELNGTILTSCFCFSTRDRTYCSNSSILDSVESSSMVSRDRARFIGKKSYCSCFSCRTNYSQYLWFFFFSFLKLF